MTRKQTRISNKFMLLHLKRTRSSVPWPSDWKTIGRQRLSSFIKLEFWKCEIRADFPWILAYAKEATFSLLNFSHFFPLNACKYYQIMQQLDFFLDTPMTAWPVTVIRENPGKGLSKETCNTRTILLLSFTIVADKNIINKGYSQIKSMKHKPHKRRWCVKESPYWWRHTQHCIYSGSKEIYMIPFLSSPRPKWIN